MNAITQARMAYLAAHPFDPNKNAAMAQTVDGQPAGFMTFPDIGEMQTLAAKLGMEFLAICHDEEKVEEWITICLGLAKSPELTGILLANVFRGMNEVIGEIIASAGLAQKMNDFAAEAWARDFGGAA